MTIKLSKALATVSLLAITVLVSCKPKNQVPPQPPTSPATNTPAAAPSPASTNVAAAVAPKAEFITPEEAKKHIDEIRTVKGKVYGVHVTQKGDVFMNVGAAYPNAPFTVACFGGKVSSEKLTALDGKTISVTGKIKDYNGKTEIVIDAEDQISQ